MMSLETKKRKEALKRIKCLQKRFKLETKMEEFFNQENILVVDFTTEDTEEVSAEELELYSQIYQDFKNRYNALAYYIFIENMNNGGYIDKVYHILYVSNYIEDWPNEHVDNYDEIIAYTYNINLKYPEIGSIKLAKKNESLGRVG